MTVLERIRAERVVAVLRGVADPDAVVDDLVAGGIRIVEITLDSRDALPTIARLRSRGDVAVLAGTVRTAADADAAIDAGAEACVAPVTDAAMIARSLERGVPPVPGALTPTEVEAAWRLGAPLVKLFPGSVGGPAYVKELLAPLSDVPLIVTGGVDASNAAAYLEAGAVAVGAGSALSRTGDRVGAARALVQAVQLWSRRAT